MTNEDFIPLEQAVDFMQPRPHRSTLYRWVHRGTRGIRLDTWLVGGRRYTTRSALHKFIERTTLAHAGGTPPDHRTALADTQAERRLDRILKRKTGDR